MSLEQIMLRADANKRKRARQLLDEMITTNRATNPDKQQWRDWQRELNDQANQY